ncbi:MAG TPA: hypothetical protein VEW03_09225 [Longimicrobiaceae bacterium]|nr:hypothetical protein [Longimicrobiaceae bacterium]
MGVAVPQIDRGVDGYGKGGRMRTSRALGVLALVATVAAAGCKVEVEDRNQDGVPEDVDVSVDSLRTPDVDLPDVDVTTDTQSITLPVPKVEINADSDSAR